MEKPKTTEVTLIKSVPALIVAFNLCDPVTVPEEFLKKWLMATNEKQLTREQVEDEFNKSKKTLRWQLIETKILHNNNISVTEEEVVKQAKDDVKYYWERYYGASGLADEQLDSLSKNILQNNEETKRIYDRLYDLKLLELFKTTFCASEVCGR